jgi:hypothetical protein
MELLLIFRRLWRRWLLVSAGVLGVAVLFLMLVDKPRPTSGLAWTRIVLDTDKSEIVHPDPHGADSLLWRGQLLADLLTDEPNVRSIAARAGLTTDQLDVVEPIKDTTAEIATPLPQRALEAAGATLVAPNVVTVEYGTSLPVISIRAVSPSRAEAVKLAQAAMDIVQANANQAGTYPTRESRVSLQGLRTDTVSPLRSRDVLGTGGRAKKLMACVILLGAWLSLLAIVPPLTRPPLPRLPRLPRRRSVGQ